jgi:hypothetical protein
LCLPFASYFKKIKMEDFDSNSPSKGLGDTIAKFTKSTGISNIVETLSDLIGLEDCGCSRRQEWLNEKIPYKSFTPIDHDPAEPLNGIYLINHQISITQDNQNIKFHPGDQILMDENHFLYPNWHHYILIGAVTKIN